MDSNYDTDSDRELLRLFAEEGTETAFGRLVDRHAAMVRGVALRCTGDAALSDEVAQSVFFLLARRAASVPADHLGGWLHRTAFFTARNARRKSLRYNQALRELGRHHDVMMDTSHYDSRSQDSQPWEEIHPYLDEAVARLPERARRPVMLRFFESRSIRDIASLTGSSEAAVRKVLERSLRRLSGLLRRRGVVTNGTALGAMLSAHTLLAPPASAAALAAGALSASNVAGAAVGPTLLMSNPLRYFGSHPFLGSAGVALLLVSVPVAMLWRENSVLRQDLERSRQSRPSIGSRPLSPVAEAPQVTQAPAAMVDVPPKEKAAPFPDKNSPAALKEKSAKEAARELTRMSQYLDGLSEDQRARILAVIEGRSLRRWDAFEKARQSGALVRLAGGIQNLTAEDKALFYAMSTTPDKTASDSDPLKAILSGDQYARHLEAMERRRVNDAEGVASDTLRSLGQAFDLSPEQKDAIFQAVAQFELTPREGGADGMASLPFGGGLRDEERDRIIREHLSQDQAELFDQRREDDRRRREQFLQTMQPTR